MFFLINDCKNAVNNCIGATLLLADYDEQVASSGSDKVTIS